VDTTQEERMIPKVVVMIKMKKKHHHKSTNVGGSWAKEKGYMENICVTEDTFSPAVTMVKQWC